MLLCTRLNAQAEIGLNLRQRLLAEDESWFLCAIAVRDLWEVRLLHATQNFDPQGSHRSGRFRMVVHIMTITLLLAVSPADGQSQATAWQTRVGKYAEAKDWGSAMCVVDEEIARAPQDMDVRAWRARVLAWAGKLPEAEKEYLEILKVSRMDPDNWMGLANVYLREGRLSEAQRAISTAEELDPERSDIHAERARILRAEGQRKEAQLEFQSALHLDPESAEARQGLVSVRPRSAT